MVEFKVAIFNQVVPIVIDPGASLSCIIPKIVEKRQLQVDKFNKP